MSIVVSCNCGKQFKVKDEFAGKKGKCPSCGSGFIVPSPARATAVAPPAMVKPKPVAPPADPGFPDWDALEDVESSGTVQEDDYVAPPPMPQRAPELAPAPRQAKQRACPACGRMLSSFALICEYCHTNLKGGTAKGGKTLNYQTPARSSGGDGSTMSGLDWAIALLCPGIGIIVGIIRVAKGQSSGTQLLIVSIIVFAISAGLKIMLATASH